MATGLRWHIGAHYAIPSAVNRRRVMQARLGPVGRLSVESGRRRVYRAPWGVRHGIMTGLVAFRENRGAGGLTEA